MMHRLLFLILLIGSFNVGANGQCTSFINTFPHYEDFEVSNGGWQSGGNSSSWAWGMPSKPIITGAAGGRNAWLTGGLSSTAYNDGEDSWLRSPCFNFTTLVNPQVSFKIFWETERNFDGATLEYSTNGGTVWQTLGSENSNSNCEGENWYNNGGIRYINFDPGWAGTVKPTAGSCLGGSGIGMWVTAKHRLNALAGQPSVRFRFRFGAGTTCNVYDGFAIDDFRIDEISPNPSAFTYTCETSNTVRFHTTDRVCQTSVLWNFGDPASGANNTSTDINPQHFFSAPGVYSVSLTTNYSNAPSSTTINDVIIVGATPSVTLPVSCNGGNGNLTVTAVGTTLPLTYTWTGFAAQTTPGLLGVPAGNYTVEITGTNVCATSASITLPEPSALSIVPTIVDANCATPGSISLVVSGGSTPYTYNWNNGATTPSITDIAGNYSVEVTDANNCSLTQNYTINSAPSFSASFTAQAANCTSATGQIITNITGGTAPYTFAWSNGATTQNATNLIPGSYDVVITDANNCVFIEDDIVVNSLPGNINLDVQVVDATCAQSNGSISITPSNGTAPYTFLWTGGNTSQNLTNLSPGLYTVVVTDALGCTFTESSIALQSTAGSLDLTINVVDAICTASNGSVNVTVLNGTVPYTYLWSDGSTQPVLNNVAPGVYGVTVTDASGCSTSENNIVVNSTTGNLTVGFNISNETCGASNGSIITSINGGFAPFTYLWSNGSTLANLSNVAAGNYSVQITDNNGCTLSSLPQAIQNLNPTIVANEQIQNVGCNNTNGSISLNPTGGTAPYTYTWNTGATAATINVPVGSYQVTITDANGCTTNVTDLTVDVVTNNLQLQAQVQNIECLTLGSISVQITGGEAPYTYLWSNGATTASIQNLSIGIYSVTVTDRNGCDAEITGLEIRENDQTLPVTLGSTKNVCPGQTITLNPGIYQTYLWGDGSTGATLTVTQPGIYSVDVTDVNGCAGSASVTVTDYCGGFLYFPQAFTPDGDGLNDTYGGLGNVGGLKYYQLTIYGRWGQKVFSTNNLNHKWDGTYKGKVLHTQTFTWVAEYIIDNRPKQFDKGTLILIR